MIDGPGSAIVMSTHRIPDLFAQISCLHEMTFNSAEFGVFSLDLSEMPGYPSENKLKLLEETSICGFEDENDRHDSKNYQKIALTQKNKNNTGWRFMHLFSIYSVISLPFTA